MARFKSPVNPLTLLKTRDKRLKRRFGITHLRHIESNLIGRSSDAESLKDKQYVYIYMSDHGEFLGEKGFWFRHQAQCEQYYQHDPCRVPFFLFTSPKFEAAHPRFREALNQLRKNKNIRTAHEHLFHTILGLMSIETPYYNRELDLTKSEVRPYDGLHPDDMEKDLSL